jgi:hypothetical protein
VRFHSPRDRRRTAGDRRTPRLSAEGELRAPRRPRWWKTRALGLAALLLFLAPWTPGCTKDKDRLAGWQVAWWLAVETPDVVSSTLDDARKFEREADAAERARIVRNQAGVRAEAAAVVAIAIAGLVLLAWPRRKLPLVVPLAALGGAAGSLFLEAVLLPPTNDHTSAFVLGDLAWLVPITACVLAWGLFRQHAWARRARPALALAAVVLAFVPGAELLWGLRAEAVVLGAALWLEAGYFLSGARPQSALSPEP